VNPGRLSEGLQFKASAIAELEAREIPYRVLSHHQAVYTVEEAARERGVRPDQVVKVMIVKGPSSFLAVLLPGDKRLSLRKLAEFVGHGRLKLASREEIVWVTGFPVGAVPPMGLARAGLSIYVDQRLAHQQIVTISSGDPEAGLELSAADLLSAVSGHLGDFSEDG